jgi:two-component system response regulator
LSTHAILLAEDSPEDTRLILNALQAGDPGGHGRALRATASRPWTICLARNAHAGRSGDDLPGVALIDLNLPKVNGLEVLRELRENPRTRLLPVVILSASSEGSATCAPRRCWAPTATCASLSTMAACARPSSCSAATGSS